MEEKIIEKIKKLLAMTEENGASENEAMVAALKAQKLMAEYNITVADIDDKDDSDEIVQNAIDIDTRNKWKYRLANIIATNFCCKTFCYGTKKIVFYGYKKHADVAAEVFKFLYKTGCKLANNYYYKCMKEGRNTKGVKNTFIIGFCDGINDVLGKQCTSLMLVTPKEVTESFEKMMEGSRTRHSSMKINHDRQAYDDGRREGRNTANARSIEG